MTEWIFIGNGYGGLCLVLDKSPREIVWALIDDELREVDVYFCTVLSAETGCIQWIQTPATGIYQDVESAC